MRGFKRLEKEQIQPFSHLQCGRWRVLSSKYIVPFFSEELADKNHIGHFQSHYNISHNSLNLVGNIIKLNKNDECDDVNTFNKHYKCVKSIDKLYDVDVNAYVVKNIDAQDTSTVFSLTKSDCKTLGIEFERGLEILPKQLDWTVVPQPSQEAETPRENEWVYNPDDLGTYPIDYESKSIKLMTIRISGCYFKGGDTEAIDLKFWHRMSHGLKDYNVCNIKILKGIDEIPYRVFVKKSPYNNGEQWRAVDNDGSLYLELDLSQRPLQPLEVRGLKFEDIFTIKIFEKYGDGTPVY